MKYVKPICVTTVWRGACIQELAYLLLFVIVVSYEYAGRDRCDFLFTSLPHRQAAPAPNQRVALLLTRCLVGRYNWRVGFGTYQILPFVSAD